MSNFIEDYLQNPSLAIIKARECAANRFKAVSEDKVYEQLASPEFNLYTEICGIQQ